MNKTMILLAIGLSLLLGGCGQKEPIKIGFIGGLTDRNSDNGQSGLNGVTLAVEQFNRQGGREGQMVELVIKDDAQNPETAQQSSRELVAAKVEAVIGPFTSGMAKVIVPITAQNGIFQVSPTITSMDFYGKDDNLFRINRTTRDYAEDYASVLMSQGPRPRDRSGPPSSSIRRPTTPSSRTPWTRARAATGTRSSTASGGPRRPPGGSRHGATAGRSSRARR